MCIFCEFCNYFDPSTASFAILYVFLSVFLAACLKFKAEFDFSVSPSYITVALSVILALTNSVYHKNILALTLTLTSITSMEMTSNRVA